jgi:polyferredoxin
MKNTMNRQRIREALVIFSFLLLPVTFAYISCPIIVKGASEGVITGGLIVFTLLFLSSLFFGRLWCGWLCPAGGLQEIYAHINNKNISINKLNWLKYLMFILIIFVPLISAIRSAGGLTTIDFFYNTHHGISIEQPGAYTIFLAQITFITAFSLLAGRRGFCRYFCPIAVIMIITRTIRNLIRWPALHLAADATLCTNCRKCSKSCPTGLDVNIMVQEDRMENVECIFCFACVDICPKKAIRYELKD